MNFRLAQLVYTAILSFYLTNAASAQAYRKLTINDFKGSPRTNGGGIIAYTNTTIDYRYIPSWQKGFYRLDFTIKLIMNKDESWIDRGKVRSSEMLTEILKHEQGHYNIAYLEQQELLRTVGRTVFYDDYLYKAKDILRRIDAKYKQLNVDYDEDTNHMLNRGQQRNWDAYFSKQIEFLPAQPERLTNNFSR
jgi:hypothetical protein